MSEYVSVIIKYEDKQEQPSFHADMEVLGGKVVGVMFDDALVEIERLENQLEECVQDD